MSAPHTWDYVRYRTALQRNAATLQIDRRVQARFDESDLVQETLVRALESHRSCCQGSTDGKRIAWLLTVQKRLLRDKYAELFAQKRDLRREVSATVGRQPRSDSTVDLIAEPRDPGPSPSAEAARREELARLTRCLDRLPPKYREVLFLRHEGRTISEITQILGVTVGSVAGLIARATKRLARISQELRKEAAHGCSAS